MCIDHVHVCMSARMRQLQASLTCSYKVPRYTYTPGPWASYAQPAAGEKLHMHVYVQTEISTASYEYMMMEQSGLLKTS